jgi:hypothetical protein
MPPNDDPPGTYCAHCGALQDANEDVIADAGEWFCRRECRDLARLGSAEQLGLEVVR